MAGTTNLIPWNPTGANQEDDAAYLADSQRAGGATDPSLFEATLANKAFYQWSIYLTALFTAFANKNFTTSDSNLSTLTAQCAHFLTTADVLPAVLNVNYAPHLTLDASQANGFFILNMTGNLFIDDILNVTPGQLIVLWFQQDGAGNRAVTYPSYVTGAAQPNGLPSSISAQLFGADLVTGRIRALGPLVCDNAGAVFPDGVAVEGEVIADTLTLNAPGTPGQILTNVGGIFVPRNPARPQGSLTDVTGSRAFGTAYQNTTGGIIYVSGAGTTGGSAVGAVNCLVGAGSPSTSVFAMEYTASVSGGKAGFGFMVPAGYFYQVNASGTVGGTPIWTETQIT